MHNMPRKKKVTEKPMKLGLRSEKAGDERQMIPADNVDAEGTAWATVGENIRKGKNGSGGGGDTTITKETIANFFNTLTGGDWRVADMTISYRTAQSDPPSVEYHDTDYSDQFGVTLLGMTCKSGIMGTPICLGTDNPMDTDLLSSQTSMFYTSQFKGRGNMMVFTDGYSSSGQVHSRVLLPFQYADSNVNSWSHNAEDDWDKKVQQWQKEDAEALQKAAVAEEHTEV